MNNYQKMGKRISNRTYNFTKQNQIKKDKRVNQIPNVEEVVLIHEENTSKINYKLEA